MGTGTMDSTQIFIPKWFSSERKGSENEMQPVKNENQRDSPTKISHDHPPKYSQPLYTNQDVTSSSPWGNPRLPNSMNGINRVHSSSMSYSLSKPSEEEFSKRSPIPIQPSPLSKGFTKNQKTLLPRSKTFQHPEPPKTIPIRKASKEEERKPPTQPSNSFVALERKIKPTKKEQSVEEKQEAKTCDSNPVNIPSKNIDQEHDNDSAVSSSIEREENFMRKLGWTENDDSDVEITQEEKEAVYKLKTEMTMKKNQSFTELKLVEEEDVSDDLSDSDSDVF